MNWEACCLQLGQLTDANWNHPLANGFTRERRLLHPATALRHSTNELLSELKLNLDLEKKKRGIGNPMYFNRRVFLHTHTHIDKVTRAEVTEMANGRLLDVVQNINGHGGPAGS